MYTILTHDVDWPRRGPGRAHVLERHDRFDEEIIRKVLDEDFNPYYGIPLIMEAEERLGIRSTFFFRPTYDDGSAVDEYRDVIMDLVRGGWEIGLHSSCVEEAASERRILESAAGVEVQGNRVHYLRISSTDDLRKLEGAGFLYDSSMKSTKDGMDVRDAGFHRIGDLVEFPITFMDAYLFAYSRLQEHEVIPYIVNGIKLFRDLNAGFVTLLWHDNSVMMRGGRVYPQLLDAILGIGGIEPVRMIDAYKSVEGRGSVGGG
ncbi:MAG: hypothetical protein ACP5UD_09245 [Conexivisphaera sp.]|jgi:peptidoglycan/xylan/chitin deacetylase (PgdA/CDA1 family)